MKAIIDHAMILAAGVGARLRPYTDNCPKPLVSVGGQPIIDHVLDRLREAGVQHAAVNTHYKAQMLEDHLRGRKPPPRIAYSREETLLDTGGGMKKALPLLGGGDFIAVSGDSFWTDDDPAAPALSRMATAWEPAKMDLLLLLQPLERMTLTEGRGDYDLRQSGRAVRSPGKSGTHMWTSVRICSRALFDDTPDGPFSFLDLMDRAERSGRLFTIEHHGDWHHISTPADLERVNDYMAAQKKRA